METARLITTSFSTADSGGPSIEILDKDLLDRVVLKWDDYYGGMPIEVLFRNVVAFKWQLAYDFLEGERDDSCYEILGSKWLALHVEQQIIPPSHSHKHYRFNFNQCTTQVECLATDYEVKA